MKCTEQVFKLFDVNDKGTISTTHNTTKLVNTMLLQQQETNLCFPGKVIILHNLQVVKDCLNPNKIKIININFIWN